MGIIQTGTLALLPSRMMRRSFFVAAVAVVVIVSAAAPGAMAGVCYGAQATSAPVSPVTKNCPQYADDSCCPAQYSTTSCEEWDGCRDSPDECSKLFGAMGCGPNCKPDFYDDYVSNGVLSLCSDFYDEILATCMPVKFCGI